MHDFFKRERLLTFIIFAAFLIIYLFSISKTLSISHDSILYLTEIENGNLVFHPHHLLYHVFTLLWMNFCLQLGFSDTIFIASSLNSLFGAMTMAFFFRMMRSRLGFDIPKSIIITMLAGFSMAFWLYSSVVEVYILPLFFMFAGIYFFSSGRLSTGKIIITTVFASLSVLFHQVYILFCISILVMILLHGSSTSLKIRYFIIFTTVCLVFIGIPYLLIPAFFFDHESFKKYLDWLTMYSQTNPSWNTPGKTWIIKIVIGISRSFVSVHPMFANPELTAMLTKAFPGKWLQDEQYLVRDMEPMESTLFIVLACIILFSLFVAFILIIKNFRKILRININLFGIATTILLAFISFFSFWDSANPEFWIPQSLLFWFFFGAWLKKYSSRKAYMLIIPLLILLCSVNFFGTMKYVINIDNDYYYKIVHRSNQLTSDNSLIVIGRSWIISDYFKKYSDRDVLSLFDILRTNDYKYEAFTSRLDSALSSGKNVIIYEEALETKSQYAPEFNRAIQEVWKDYQFRLKKLPEGNTTFYQLRNK